MSWHTPRRCLSVAVVGVMLLAITSRAQIGRIAGQDWTASGADAQRSSWIRTDAFISPASVVKPEFKLQWSLKLDNQPRQLSALTSPATVTVSLMFKPLTVIGGSSNRVYAIDNETGVLYWKTQFDAPAPSAATPECPGGLTAGIGRPTQVIMTPGRGGGAARGRGPFMGGVGEPGEGVPADLMAGGMFGPGGAARGAAPGAAGGAAGRGDAPAGPGAPPTADAAARGGADAGARGGADAAGRGPGAPGGFGGPGGGRGGPIPVYAISSDGVLRRLGANSGKEVQQPVPFLPANARVSDVIVVDDVAYAATSHNCGGAPNGIWATDLAGGAKSAVSWKTGSANPAGPAFASDGTLFVSVGSGPAVEGGHTNAIVALEPRTLRVKDWFTESSADFSSAPVVFTHKGRELLAASTRDGRLFLLDVKLLGGADHATAVYSTPRLARGTAESASLATWEDSSGTRWVVMPVAGAPAVPLSTANGPVPGGTVMALRVTDEGGRLALQPAWSSRDMTSPGAPIVVNGVVFAASTGQYLPTTGAATAAERIKRSRPAVLYALDGATGKELWNSGKTLTSFVASGSLWTSVGQVHVATFDGTLYTFGFPLERY